MLLGTLSLTRTLQPIKMLLERLYLSPKKKLWHLRQPQIPLFKKLVVCKSPLPVPLVTLWLLTAEGKGVYVCVCARVCECEVCRH